MDIFWTQEILRPRLIFKPPSCILHYAIQSELHKNYPRLMVPHSPDMIL